MSGESYISREPLLVSVPVSLGEVIDNDTYIDWDNSEIGPLELHLDECASPEDALYEVLCVLPDSPFLLSTAYVYQIRSNFGRGDSWWSLDPILYEEAGRIFNFFDGSKLPKYPSGISTSAAKNEPTPTVRDMVAGIIVLADRFPEHSRIIMSQFIHMKNGLGSVLTANENEWLNEHSDTIIELLSPSIMSILNDELRHLALPVRTRELTYEEAARSITKDVLEKLQLPPGVSIDRHRDYFLHKALQLKEEFMSDLDFYADNAARVLAILDEDLGQAMKPLN